MYSKCKLHTETRTWLHKPNTELLKLKIKLQQCMCVYLCGEKKNKIRKRMDKKIKCV